MLSSCPSFEAANVKWWGVQLCQSLGYCMSDSVMLELISILPAGFPKALPIDVKLGGPCKAGTWRRDLAVPVSGAPAMSPPGSASLRSVSHPQNCLIVFLRTMSTSRAAPPLRGLSPSFPGCLLQISRFWQCWSFAPSDLEVIPTSWSYHLCVLPHCSLSACFQFPNTGLVNFLY